MGEDTQTRSAQLLEQVSEAAHRYSPHLGADFDRFLISLAAQVEECALTAKQEHRIEQAVKFQRLLVELRPQDERAKITLGQWLCRVGEFAEARDILEFPTVQNPRNDLYYGWALAETDSPREGVREMARAIRTLMNTQREEWFHRNLLHWCDTVSRFDRETAATLRAQVVEKFRQR